ncbi:Serpentine Receptor, class BC (Class B-like) [Caenorhabditis elegans]|uniref:Serpentine Receptor, class BC (Class B-like) n=1 Tax=Caenorhabditis elegans TaxID=6239 RepID=Q5CZ32_CAEEL|nr:Serpentine Receptor, class BC (Class B-like) [Caenorhabditis elegans]CAI58636.1 Serpentine Receptor, class BC (Class B-like) [Caenorhabditis elegans]|eukprot:NP_001023967.1 Serpentine Receptor, class BC (class B-like) [Caenorhabditis elegans]
MLLVKTASLVLTIIFSQSLCCTMIYLLYAVFCSKRIAFRPSLSIFYCRFIIDVFLTLSAAFNQYVLFGYCGNSIDVPLECDDFKCTVNSCYYNYYLTQEQIVHFVIGAMTVILCARLFIMYLTAKSEVTKFLSQATRVALLDSLTIFTFFILPSFAYAQFPATDFEIFGPLLALFKRVGALIEAVFICRIFLREKNTAPNTISPMS